MEWYVVAIGLLSLLVVLIALGIPIPFALAAASLPFLLAIQDWSTSLVSTELMLWGVWFNYVLVAVPLFVFVGEVVGRSEIGSRLYQAMHKGIPITGSAAYGSVAASAGFGAVCGSSMIGALTIGGVALPEMLKLGYDRRLASGVLAAGGTLSVLIPPSLILLYYGILTDVSIGQLFIAGVVPGLLMSIAYALVVFMWKVLSPSSVPRTEKSNGLSFWAFLVSLMPIAVIGMIIIASIYLGIATPTEAAAVAALVTLGFGFTIGGLTRRGFVDAFIGTLRTMGFLGLLLAGAFLFGFVLNYHRVPQQFTEAFLALQLPPIAILAFVMGFYLVVGMFLEPVSLCFITLPTLFPLVSGAGYDPLFFGIIFTITMEIAVLTPPVGLNLYVIQGIAPDKVSLVDVILGSLPFVGAMCALIALLILFPQLATWLPLAMK